ncbi:hypothetical protein [Lagierella sp.]|uniref:hypothetical protein n=1 Tax=Lagierella sp. TaxID=2849657 RepID=UPI002607B5C1|nr:hypothetical protein [Lagierella sp.]
MEILTETIQRSLTGYLLVLPMLISYFLFLKNLNKNQTKSHIILSFIFCYYLIGILTMTGIGKNLGFLPRFDELSLSDLTNVSIEKILNVILFVPLGLFVPLLYKNYNKIQKSF